MASAALANFRPEWLDWPETKQLMEVLEGQRFCFYGGALRDYVLGVEPRDIDIKLDLPFETAKLLLANSPFAMDFALTLRLCAINIFPCGKRLSPCYDLFLKSSV